MDEFYKNNSYNFIQAVAEWVVVKKIENFVIGRSQVYKSKISHRPRHRKDCKFYVKIYVNYDESCEVVNKHIKKHSDFYPAEEGQPTPCKIPRKYQKPLESIEKFEKFEELEKFHNHLENYERLKKKTK